MEDQVWDALNNMRPPFVPYETDIHKMVERSLLEAGIPFVHEARIGKGCRIDYLAGDVGIEIKKGKPAPAILVRQLARYAACEAVASMIVVSQRSVKVPRRVGGKPARVLVLPQLWGVALP